MVMAAITPSVDGSFTGPGDGPGCGLGVGAERLDYWSSAGDQRGARRAAAGRRLRLRGQPYQATARARSAAGGKDMHVMGGADVMRQGLAAGHVDELTIIVAPILLGAGERLFDGFSQSLDLEHLGVRQSEYATFVGYRVKK
jgi:dihydrofolate reductase